MVPILGSNNQNIQKKIEKLKIWMFQSTLVSHSMKINMWICSDAPDLWPFIDTDFFGMWSTVSEGISVTVGLNMHSNQCHLYVSD